jgi:ubiquinone/menaquinone biosynthesis C-methylase UbiE
MLAMTAAGRSRYCVRCLDKVGYAFRGDETLLDGGCGDGFVAELLRQRVRRVVAVDVAPSESWQDRSGLTFCIENAETLPFDDRTFDVVHSKDSLHHMGSPDRALAEYRRVLRPGGAALIIEANRYNPSLYPHMTLAGGHEHFTRRLFRRLVGALFPHARFGAFEAHYVPQLERLLSIQHAIEEMLERFPPVRPVLAYNFAVATPSSVPVPSMNPPKTRDHTLLTVLAAIYVVLPFDVIPDFIPFVGHFDDAIIVALVLRAVQKQWLASLRRLLRLGRTGSTRSA